MTLTYLAVDPRRRAMMDEAVRRDVKHPNDHLPGQKQPSGQKLIAYDEVQKHRSPGDCWVIIDVSLGARAAAESLPHLEEVLQNMS